MLESIDFNSLTHTYLIPWGINLGFALLILIVGRYAVKLLAGIAGRILKNAGMDNILIKFINSILTALLFLVVTIMALNKLGVDTTSLIALIGAAGLAVGLALKDSLQNFAAGVMLIMFRPFKEGDFVEAGGTSGIVENIAIFASTLRTPDNRRVIIPNGSIYSGVITNYSAKDTRRVDMVFGIGYDDDIKKAKEIITRVLNSENKILNTPEPVVAVDELADSSVNFVVRPWVRTEDYWDVKFNVTERVKLEFDKNGISIPFPQMDIHLDKADES